MTFAERPCDEAIRPRARLGPETAPARAGASEPPRSDRCAPKLFSTHRNGKEHERATRRHGVSSFAAPALRKPRVHPKRGAKATREPAETQRLALIRQRQ